MPRTMSASVRRCQSTQCTPALPKDVYSAAKRRTYACKEALVTIVHMNLWRNENPTRSPVPASVCVPYVLTEFNVRGPPGSSGVCDALHPGVCADLQPGCVMLYIRGRIPFVAHGGLRARPFRTAPQRCDIPTAIPCAFAWHARCAFPTTSTWHCAARMPPAGSMACTATHRMGGGHFKTTPFDFGPLTPSERIHK